MTGLPLGGVPARRHIDTSGFREIAERFGGMSEAADAETVATMAEVAQYLERQTAFGTPVDRGFLRGGVTSGSELTAPHLASAFVGVQGVAANYALPIEQGARPHWPPPDAIEGWVQRKGLDWTDAKGRRLSVKSMAFLISRKIARAGYAGAHMARAALDFGDAEINRIVERRFSAFVDRMFQ